MPFWSHVLVLAKLGEAQVSALVGLDRLLFGFHWLSRAVLGRASMKASIPPACSPHPTWPLKGLDMGLWQPDGSRIGAG